MKQPFFLEPSFPTVIIDSEAFAEVLVAFVMKAVLIGPCCSKCFST